MFGFICSARKRQKAYELLSKKHFISTQVLAENANVCRNKFHLEITVVKQHIQNLLSNCDVVVIQPDFLEKALSISEKYHYRFYDSLIIATALEADCTVLYSEDLHDKQVIEKKLTIVNPFRGF